MTVTYASLQYMWNQVILPRVGDVYVFGGSLSPTAVQQGTDCTGACSEVNEALLFGPAMNWQRQFWTGTFAGVRPGQIGPFGNVLSTVDWVCIANPHDAPADAAAIFSVLQLPDATQAHMVCAVPALDGSGLVGIESGGSYSENGHSVLHISPTATSIYDPMFNQFFYLKGPIVGWPDGITPVVKEPQTPMAFQNNVTDTLFADVSEYQVPVTNAYTDAGYRWLSIRSNDGTHRDAHFAANYAWCKAATDDGRMLGFIDYFYWRPGSGDVDTLMDMVNTNGGVHPKMAVMMDVESGGNPGGDESPELNAEHDRIVQWLGDFRRVIAYANLGDARSMWVRHPDEGWILAGYGSNPSDPLYRKIAHQYTDGQGYGGGLPEGAPPFGNCDMNSADGLSVQAFADALGVGSVTVPPPVVTPPASNQPDQALSDTAAIHAVLWKETFLLDLTDRPRDPTLTDDQYGHMLNARAEGLINQALLVAIAQALKIDVVTLIAQAKASLTPKASS